MNNLNNNFNTYPFQNPAISQYFLQPQGIVYFINNLNEFSNIIMNSKTIVGICIPEETCYVKILENGIQNLSVYKLVKQENNNKTTEEILIELEKRIDALEGTKKGGRLDELI